MSQQGSTTFDQENDTEQSSRGPLYSGKQVTANNYNLFSKEERQNAHKELKAFLKGNLTYKAKLFIPDQDGGGKFERVTKQVSRI